MELGRAVLAVRLDMDQGKVLGCIYDWLDGSGAFTLGLMMLLVVVQDISPEWIYDILPSVFFALYLAMVGGNERITWMIHLIQAGRYHSSGHS